MAEKRSKSDKSNSYSREGICIFSIRSMLIARSMAGKGLKYEANIQKLFYVFIHEKKKSEHVAVVIFGGSVCSSFYAHASLQSICEFSAFLFYLRSFTALYERCENIQINYLQADV